MRIYKAMAERYCVCVATALAVAAWSGSLRDGRAAPDDGWSEVNRLISSTFFSDTCGQKAASLGILPTTDAQFLVEAFAQRFASDPPDVRAEARVWSGRERIAGAYCEVPAVALINLLRLNGVAAELVQVWLRPASSSEPARSNMLGALAVYVPSLDRYIDPAAADGHNNTAFDRFVRAQAGRVHIIGPAPNADQAIERCASTCIVQYGQAPVSDPVLTDPVRVRTETIHVP